MKDETVVSGLLKKREDLALEAVALREQQAIIANAIESIDRVLETFGYEGELEAKTPRSARIVLFYRNELRQFVLNELRKAAGPLSSRELAERLVALEGKSTADRKMMVDIVRRVSKACRMLRHAGAVVQAKDGLGRVIWGVAG
jgi:hypothetical protein